MIFKELENCITQKNKVHTSRYSTKIAAAKTVDHIPSLTKVV